MSKTLKIVLISIFVFILIAVAGIGGLVYIVIQDIEKNSCYALEMEAPDETNFDINLLVEAFNTASEMRLELQNNGDYLGNNEANSLEIVANPSRISVKNTESIPFDNEKQEFAAENIGFAMGAVLVQDGMEISEITPAAEKVGGAMASRENYSTVEKGWNISVTAKCE